MTANSHSVRIGTGERDFAAARAAVLALRMFELPWLAAAADGPVRAGANIAVSGRVLGLWWTNVCRVVEVIDQKDRSGFVYATVQGHMLLGAERFAVERDADGAVWFEVLAHSKPLHPLARLGAGLVIEAQRRFAIDAGMVLAAAIAPPCECPS
jgi:uncharacterized protein (UPF0548 family)